MIGHGGARLVDQNTFRLGVLPRCDSIVVTPLSRTVHSLWDNTNAHDLRFMIGMLYSPPLKRQLFLA